MGNSISDIINEESNSAGIPSWIPFDIGKRESGLNPRLPGDNNTSFGLFQLHRGGLAPSNLSEEQLYDPRVNTRIAVTAMKPYYDKGVASGYQGVDLLDYVANSAGWPGQLGVDWTNTNRPDYNSRLNQIFAGTGGDTSGDAYHHATDLSTHQETGVQSSAAGSIFRSINQGEQIQSYSEWQKKLSLAGKINPFSFFSYLGEQGNHLSARVLVTILGLIIFAVAVSAFFKVGDMAQSAITPEEFKTPEVQQNGL